MNWPWSVLELPGPSELPEIRRAYAQKLKTTHPEEDPEGFQRLHNAYQQACRLARQKKRGPMPSLTAGPARAPKPSRPETPSGKKEPPKDGSGGEAEDWDYEKLLKGTGEAKDAKKPPEDGSGGEAEDWDYEELLKGTGEAKDAKKPPEDGSGEAEDWDYEALLKGTGEAKDAKKPPEDGSGGEAEDWDYEALLKGTGEAKAAKEQPEDGSGGEAKNWDHDKLLKGAGGVKTEEAQPKEDRGGEAEEQTSEEPPRREAGSKKEDSKDGERTKDWDFERLFAEGEEEARSAQRRKIEELREKNRARVAAQEKEQRRRAAHDEETWAAVMAATHALELLLSTGAPVAQWRAFLHSQVFWNVKSNLDFIFALEDFLELNPDLPLAVRKAIYAAYGFERNIPVECRILARLLGLDRKTRWRLRWTNSRFRREWRTWPPKRRFATVFSVIFLGILVLTALWGLLEDGIFAEKTPWQETMCGQLETDYGRRFIHPYEDGEYIFAPEEDPELLFYAYQEDGGYQTNYPERMVMDQMRKFAEKWGLPLEYDSAGEGYQGQLGETPGAYLLQFPLTGKGDAIRALGNLLESLKGRSWYQPRTPDFEVFLAYGDLHFYKFRSTEEDFDADYARVVYETKFGPEICRYVAENTGMAAADMGQDAYVLVEQGTLSVDGEDFFWCAGMSKPPDSELLRHYLLSADGCRLFILSNSTMEAGFTLEGLRHPSLIGTRSIPELGDHASVEIVYTL